MPIPQSSKGSRKSSNDHRSTTGGSSKKRRDRTSTADDAVNAIPQSIMYLVGKQLLAHSRSKCQKQFEELAQRICAMSLCTLPESAHVADASPSSASNPPTEQLFPTLEVGYLARALGLNVSKKQVVSIVELVEDDAPSTGFVDRRKLGHVLVDAMMTGTLGGPTLLQFSAKDGAATASVGDDDSAFLSAERLKSFVPSVCVREEEATLLRAFEALDTQRKGYLEEAQLRSAMMDGEEGLSAEEVDDMWIAMRDPGTNRAYYRDFVEMLAGE